jgi:hypothetical protein
VQFANFGSAVTLFGIKDIPANALSGFCTGSVPCPPDETVLVVASGFTDPDTGESEGTGLDPDAVNICTNVPDETPVSCALLLDTSTNPGLTSPLWQNGTLYSLTAKILDPFLHQQTVVTAGTSGTDEPAFSQSHEPIPVIDNAVIWTDQGQPAWALNTAYAVTVLPGTPYIVDSNHNLQTVTVAGTSGPGPTAPSFNMTGTTIDGLVWTDQGAWQKNYTFSVGADVGDGAGHPHVVFTAGTSGSGSLPAGGWNDIGGLTIDNAVIWTNQSPVVPYMGEHSFALNTLILEGGHAQQAVAPGTSGGSAPNFSTTGGRTIDNAVTWADLGQAVWHSSFSYGSSAIIVDGAGHVQQVATPGTSGPTQPTFSAVGGSVTDGLRWTDLGSETWLANNPYSLNTAIVDGAGHVQQVITAGTSGPGPNPPSFDDTGGMTSDGTVTWQDRGLAGNWTASTQYALNAFIAANSHVQQATSAGTSGTAAPSFSTSGVTVSDNAVVWADQGLLSGSTVFTWQANNPYSLNGEIVDSANHVELVMTAGTSGPGPTTPTFIDGGTITDNTVTWTDQGQAVWRPSFSYGLNAVIVDPAGHVQQVTTGGTSGPGPNAPSFNDAGSTTTDNQVTWTDRGLLTGNATFTWQMNNSYSLNAMIVDPAGDVELVTTAGTSGPGPAPTFKDGGTVIDGLVWLDIGPTVTWAAGASYASGTLVVDTGSFLQKVTTAGITGTPAHPVWNEGPGGNTVDGLQWTDYGLSVWQVSHQFTLGNLISDGATHAQKVTEAGTSGAGPFAPAFSTTGPTTIDNAVTWMESHPAWAATHSYKVGNLDTLILDTNNNVQLATNNVPSGTTTGISGPSQPSSAGHNPWSTTQGATTIDGLQWTNQATPATSIIARYPVNGKTTLQSLALDPLVANCMGNICPGLPLPTRKTANFWLGDSGSDSFYKLDFATGNPITLTGGCPTPCGIQSLVVYGGEGANQPGLASLVSGLTLNSANLFTTSAQFLQNTITSTLSNNSGGSPLPTPISLYASLVDKNSCFTDPLFGKLACKPTVSADTNKALVWKLDFPVNGAAGLPTTETLNTSFAAVGGGIDNSTDVFVDEQFDDTTFVGTDPGTRSLSVHSLHEVSSVPQTTAQCTYSSPLKNVSYKTTRGTLNFIFTCPGLSQTQFQHMHPTLSLVKKNPPQSPQFIPLSGTNGKGPYRFDSSGNFWTFQWNLNGATAGTYEGTTFDSPSTPFDSPAVQSFTVTFCLSKSPCP